MFVLAEFRGNSSPKKVKDGIVLCQAQFLVEGKSFDSLMNVAVFNEDISSSRPHSKRLRIILEFSQRLNKGFINNAYINRIEDTKKIEQFSTLINFNQKVPN